MLSFIGCFAVGILQYFSTSFDQLTRSTIDFFILKHSTSTIAAEASARTEKASRHSVTSAANTGRSSEDPRTCQADVFSTSTMINPALVGVNIAPPFSSSMFNGRYFTIDEQHTFTYSYGSSADADWSPPTMSYEEYAIYIYFIGCMVVILISCVAYFWTSPALPTLDCSAVPILVNAVPEVNKGQSAPVDDEEPLSCQNAGDRCHSCLEFRGQYHHINPAQHTRPEEVREKPAGKAIIDQEHLNNAVREALGHRKEEFKQEIMEEFKDEFKEFLREELKEEFKKELDKCSLSNPDVQKLLVEAVMRALREQQPAIQSLAKTCDSSQRTWRPSRSTPGQAKSEFTHPGGY